LGTVTKFTKKRPQRDRKGKRVNQNLEGPEVTGLGCGVGTKILLKGGDVAAGEATRDSVESGVSKFMVTRENRPEKKAVRGGSSDPEHKKKNESEGRFRGLGEPGNKT